MIDKSLVRSRLSELERYYNTLRALRRLSVDEMEADVEKFWTVEHGLQLSTQLVLDIGNHILAGLGVSRVEDYKDILLALGREGCLPVEFAGKIADMAGLRNLLVHEYLKVDPRKLHDALQTHSDDFREFAAHIEKYLGETHER
ncbi:MAG TPA: DUF86 domain-containing protein [Nitrospirota bacterium]|jgi:uncharacterized protein YutE (UPF0331/DUF86 family)